MKKLAIVLLISLLLQSCFSYTRAIDFNAGAVVEKQKVKIYKNNGTELKGKVLSANKDQITIIYQQNKTGGKNTPQRYSRGSAQTVFCEKIYWYSRRCTNNRYSYLRCFW